MKSNVEASSSVRQDTRVSTNVDTPASECNRYQTQGFECSSAQEPWTLPKNLNGQYLYFTWGENFGDIWVMDVVYQLAIHAPVVDARIRPRQPGSRTRRTRSRSRILPTSVPGKAGCTWPSSSICFRVRVIGWAVANHLRTDLARSARQRESHETRRKLLQEERGCLIKLSTTAGQAQL